MIDINKIRKNTESAIDNAENIIAKKRKQIEGIIDKEILKASDSKKYETTFYYGLLADLFKKDEIKDFNDIKRYVSDVIVPAYEKEGYSITLSSIYVNNPKYDQITISWKEAEKAEPIDLGTVELFTDEDGYKCKRRIEYWDNPSRSRKCETVCKLFGDMDVPKYVIDFDVDGKAKCKTEYCTFLGKSSVDSKIVYDCDGNVAEVFQYVPNGKVLEHTKYKNGIKTVETHYDIWESNTEENSDKFGVVSCKILYDIEGYITSTTEYEYGKKVKFKEFIYVPSEHYSRLVKESLFNCNGYVYAVKVYHLNGKVKSEMEYYMNSYRLRSYKEYDTFGRDTLEISYRDGVAVCKIEHIYEGCARKYLIDTEYDSKGNWTKKTKLDSKGNIVSVEIPNTVDRKVLETETYRDGSSATFKLDSTGEKIGIKSMIVK